ncbi:hypothetical protein [Actinoallomurus rhizosphaericola]|uniref:hypothetical protein n=1 Tax=Actinoallomurus rhizosphaericola TaxID=2952536 RepID=UPI002092C426|nr:hypothetical protein [Actinoallomurus rhizosphaericola]MCO5999803.1 hypothetical protein [Actinoallomurus rhizosphaericola]
MAAVVAQVQRRLPGWVIVRAPYHGGLSAFGACTRQTTVIDASDPDTLVALCRAAELAAASSARTAAP